MTSGSRVNLFVVISGAGWLLDFMLLGLFVSRGVDVALANFFSASVAASFVYWASRVIVFKRRLCRAAVSGYFKYYLYSVFAIVVFSVVIQFVSKGVGWFLVRSGIEFAVSMTVLVSKALVTPFNLLLNYLVADRIQKRLGGLESE